jgi:hypothetical protein
MYEQNRSPRQYISPRVQRFGLDRRSFQWSTKANTLARQALKLLRSKATDAWRLNNTSLSSSKSTHQYNHPFLPSILHTNYVLMAEYKLWYFIEGEDVLGSVTISRDETVEDLRIKIRRKCSQSYCKGIDTVQLVLLKVCHKTSSLFLPAMTFLTFRLT